MLAKRSHRYVLLFALAALYLALCWQTL